MNVTNQGRRHGGGKGAIPPPGNWSCSGAIPPSPGKIGLLDNYITYTKFYSIELSIHRSRQQLQKPILLFLYKIPTFALTVYPLLKKILTTSLPLARADKRGVAGAVTPGPGPENFNL